MKKYYSSKILLRSSVINLLLQHLCWWCCLISVCGHKRSYVDVGARLTVFDLLLETENKQQSWDDAVSDPTDRGHRRDPNSSPGCSWTSTGWAGPCSAGTTSCTPSARRSTLCTPRPAGGASAGRAATQPRTAQRPG